MYIYRYSNEVEENELLEDYRALRSKILGFIAKNVYILEHKTLSSEEKLEKIGELMYDVHKGLLDNNKYRKVYLGVVNKSF